MKSFARKTNTRQNRKSSFLYLFIFIFSEFFAETIGLYSPKVMIGLF
jgi:hypothetical protein